MKAQNRMVITNDMPEFPLALRDWPEFYAMGDLEILQTSPVALFCSRKCPGDKILEAYDLAKELRRKGTTVISGYQSIIDKDCVDILLRGTQPLIICPARSIWTRIPKPLQPALDAGRLLILSPFKSGQNHPTKELAETRNRFIADLATEVIIIYAHPGGSLDRLLCRPQSNRRTRDG